MKRLALLAVLVLPLGACAKEVANLEAAYNVAANGVITQNELDIARSSYDGAFLGPLAAYRKLGYCATGTKITLQKPCADRALVARLEASDAVVRSEFDTVQEMITAGDNAGLPAEWKFLQSAIATAEGVAAANGVK